MKKSFIVLLMLFGCGILNAQQQSDVATFKIAKDTTKDSVLAAFPGNLNGWLSQQLKYPDSAQQYHLSGTVYVSFVIEADGTVSNVNLIQGAEHLLDNEALIVISKMPRWKPGTKHGKPERQHFNIPINFRAD